MVIHTLTCREWYININSSKVHQEQQDQEVDMVHHQE